MAKMHSASVLRNYKYEVKISNVSDFGFGSAAMGFSTVSGLSDESEVIEYREGTNASYPAKMPGQVSIGDVTFENGIAPKYEASSLIQWRKAVKEIMEDATTTTDGLRATITITVKGESSETGDAVFRLLHAWPSALEIGDLDAGSSEVLIQTLTVVAEQLQYGDGNTGAGASGTLSTGNENLA